MLQKKVQFVAEGGQNVAKKGIKTFRKLSLKPSEALNKRHQGRKREADKHKIPARQAGIL